MSAGIRAGSSNDGYVQVNGNDIITALSGGNVGIGNTSPSTKLHVNGTVTATNFVGAVNGTSSGNPTLTNGANNRIITATGANALTGETNLQWDGETLYINRSSNTVEGLSISNSNNSQGSAAAQLNLSGGDNSYANIRLECNGTSHHIRQDGSGNLKFYNNTTDRVHITSAGKLSVKSSAVNANYLSLIDNDSSNEIWRVGQASDGDGYVEVLEDGGTVGCRLDASGNSFTMGNFGVGVASPGVRFSVASTSPAVCDIHHSDGGTNDEARIILGALAGSPPSQRGAGIAAVNNGAGHDLIINTSPSHSLGPTEKVRIKSGGAVGIGTDNPVGNLEVRDTKANLIVAKDGLPVKSNSDLAASYDMIQLGAGGALASYSATSVTADTMFIHNAYRHSGNNWKRRYADTAARMRVNSPANTWIFETAATGSADSDITSWAESLRITSTGQLQATGAADVRLTLGSSGTAGTNNSVHIRADSANLKFMAASGGSTLFETNGEEQFKLDSTGTRVCRRGVNFPNPNNTGSEITAAVFKLGSDNIQIQEKYPNGAYADRCDIVIRTNSGYGAGQSDKLRLTAGGNIYLAGRQYLTRSGVAPLGNAGNMRENFFQAIAASGSHTFQIPNSYGGGLVYVVGSRFANANIQTTKIYAIAIRTTANAHLSSAIASVNGQSGSFSFTVTGASKGITVTNNDSTFSCNCFVTFDITGFVA